MVWGARAEVPGRGTARRPAGSGQLAGAGAVVAVALLAGSYGLDWSWTGFASNDSVWDWLHLLILPVVIAALPVWVRTHQGFKERWRAVLGGCAVVMAVLAVGGYGLRWTWTGFQGNRLWDWLHLLVLPVVVGILPLWLESRRRLRRRWLMLLGVVLVAFAVVVAGGYGLGWTWTGFQGNRLWDWLQLLLVPFLVPMAFAWLATRLEAAESAEEAAAAGAAGAIASSASTTEEGPPGAERGLGAEVVEPRPVLGP
ncbi:MAG: hypothetical protein ACRDYD_14095 [Acidimicrobiales bacterium]